MNGKPTTEMKLQAALEALRGFTGMMYVERMQGGPGPDKLFLTCKNRNGPPIIVIPESGAGNDFLDNLEEALNNARMVTGELTFP